MATEYSRAPVEPDETQPGLAAEAAKLSRDERAELERLRAESTELRGQASGHGSPGRRRRFNWRTLVAVLLIVVGCMVAPVAVLGV